MQIDFDELNYIIYRYLLEVGYEYSAYAFFTEAKIPQLGISPDSVPFGLLTHILQRALQMLDIEIHLDQKGYLHMCNQPLTFLKPHSCATMNILNQAIPREPLKVTTVTQGDKFLKCLENLPKPILIAPQKSTQQLYQPLNTDDEIQQIIQQKLKREHEQKKQELEQKKQEQVVAYKPDVVQSLQAANYIIDKINLPQIKQEDIAVMQKQVSLAQQKPEIQKETILQDKPKYQQLQLYTQISQGQITAINTIHFENLVGTEPCRCKSLNCQCPQDTVMQPIPDVQLYFVGTQLGQFHVIQVQQQQQNFLVSKDMLKNSQNKSKIIKILCIANQSRVIIIQEDAGITVFRINFIDKLIVNKLYQGHPLGNFKTRSAVLSPNFEYLAVYGFSAVPLLIRLRDSAPIRLSKEDNFDQIIEADGFSMLTSMSNLSQACCFSNTQTEVIDCIFISNSMLAFIRCDGVFQVNELEMDCLNNPNPSYYVQSRKFIKQTVNRMLLHDRFLIILTTEHEIYEVALDSADMKLIKRTPEFRVQQAEVVQKHGIVCLADNAHIFLFNQFQDDQPSIKLDWNLLDEVHGDEVELHTSHDRVVLISNHNNTVYQININEEEVAATQVFSRDRIMVTDLSSESSVYGTEGGHVCMRIVSQVV